MFKRVLVVVVAVAGCQGPETFRARFFDAGAPTGAAGALGSGGTGILPITTGQAGSTGAAGDGSLTGSGGTGVVTGVAGSGSGAGGDPLGAAGAVGAAGAAGPGAAGAGGSMASAGAAGVGATAGSGGAVGAAGSGGGRTGGVDAGARDAAPEAAAPSVEYASTGWKPTASITAVGTADLPPNAFDGKPATRWTTGRNQMGDESFTVDLGQVESVSRVLLDDTTNPQDFPVAYTLEVSTNNTTFTVVKMGMGATMTDIQFARVNARYIRIRQTGMTAAGGSWWSIDELKIFS